MSDTEVLISLARYQWMIVIYTADVGKKSSGIKGNYTGLHMDRETPKERKEQFLRWCEYTSCIGKDR